MPHVRESEPRPDDLEGGDPTAVSGEQPKGTSGAQPVRTDDMTPAADAPGEGGATNKDRQSTSVGDAPGSDR
jgi:hypothetical protein